MNYFRKVTIIIFALTLISCSTKETNDLGLFDQLFGKKDVPINSDNKPINFNTTQLVKTGEMLDEDLYWSIIEKSIKSTSDQDEQEQFLIREIAKLTPKEMIGFSLRTKKNLYDSYSSEMWCAGYIMNGGCSDDGFDYFRNWVISRGKETYYKAKENPDNLIGEVDDDLEMYEFESFSFIAFEAFNRKTGKDLYDYIDDENFRANLVKYTQFELTWQEENPESMKKICPKLFAKLWNR